MAGHISVSTLFTGVLFFTLGHRVNNFLPLSAVATGVVCFIVGYHVNKIVHAVEEKNNRDKIVFDNCLEPANVDTKKESASNEDVREAFPLKDDETEELLVDAPEDHSMNGTLLSGKFRSPLIQILNQTDPVSFVRMASTCRSLRTICLNCREISVRFPCIVVFVKDMDRIVYGIRFKYLKGKQGHLTVYGPMLRNLKKLPFHFEIHAKFKEFLFMEPIDVTEMDNYIKQFPRFSVRKLYVHEESDIHCWPQLLKFIQDHGVKRLNARDYYINVEVLKSILMIKFDKLKLATKIPQGMLCKIGARVVEITHSDVTAEDFLDLVHAIARNEVTDIEDWDFENLNDNFCNAESFTTCFNEFTKISFTHEGPLPSDRPLVAFEDDTNCFMLTGQHKVFGFSHYTVIKSFDVCPIDGSHFKKGPTAFHPFTQ